MLDGITRSWNKATTERIRKFSFARVALAIYCKIQFIFILNVEWQQIRFHVKNRWNSIQKCLFPSSWGNAYADTLPMTRVERGKKFNSAFYAFKRHQTDNLNWWKLFHSTQVENKTNQCEIGVGKERRKLFFIDLLMEGNFKFRLFIVEQISWEIYVLSKDYW